MEVKKFNSKEIKNIQTDKFDEIGKIRLKDGTELRGAKIKEHLVQEIKNGKRTLSQLESRLQEQGVAGSQTEKRGKLMRILRNINREVPVYLRDLDRSYEEEREKKLHTGVSIHDIRKKSGGAKFLKVDTSVKEKNSSSGGVNPVTGDTNYPANTEVSRQKNKTKGANNKKKSSIDPIGGNANINLGGGSSSKNRHIPLAN